MADKLSSNLGNFLYRVLMPVGLILMIVGIIVKISNRNVIPNFGLISVLTVLIALLVFLVFHILKIVDVKLDETHLYLTNGLRKDSISLYDVSKIELGSRGRPGSEMIKISFRKPTIFGSKVWFSPTDASDVLKKFRLVGTIDETGNGLSHEK